MKLIKLAIASVVALLISDLGMASAADKSVKVFILAGQSNMEGHGKVEYGRNPEYKKGVKGVRREIKGGLYCLRSLATDPETSATYKHLLDAEGKWVEHDNVLISTTTGGKKTGKLSVGFGAGNWFGPELGFGHVVGDAIKEPVLIIKTAWGGHSLGIKFRPPSAGQPNYMKKAKEEEVGSSYRKMIEIVNDITGDLGKHFPELKGYKAEIAGFGWHQGYNDGCSEEMTAEYEKNMALFIKDVRKDLGVKNLPFVIANTGMGGVQWTKGKFLTLCQAQMAIGDPQKHPEFKGTVTSVDTIPFKDLEEREISKFGYHWNHSAESHYKVGDAMGKAMVTLLK
ncbi:MAG: hypothetical protein ACI9FG_000536 [Crocinitomicaceae bacterium]|jgi:hypothetical protein